jgi:hypothetical protein
MSRAGYLLLLGTITACALAGPAPAAEVRTSFSPAAVSGPPPWTATYRVDFTTGAEEEKFEATAVDRLEGPGRLELIQPLHGDVFGCLGPGVFRHRPLRPVPFDTYLLTVPPRTTSTLVFSKTVFHYPWPGEDLSFKTYVTPVAPDGTHGARQTVTVAGPDMNVPRGVLIELSRSPSPSTILKGIAKPPVDGRAIELRAFRQAPGVTQVPTRSRHLAVVHTNADGQFAYRFRPQLPGKYSIYALVRADPPDFAMDRSPCPAFYSVRASRSV